MEPFNFEAANSSDAALKAHAKSTKSRFIAGGTTLVDLMKLHVEKPDYVVDINALPLNRITEDSNSILVGAMVSNTELAQNSIIVKNVPFLSQAVLSGASPQLRNLASVGGNLLQRTRCSYFRDTACKCNKREPGSGCDAIGGINRSHAVLGVSDKCIAAHPSDMCTAMAALDVKLHLKGPGGDRVVELSNFYRKPGESPHIENSLHEDELITMVEIPKKAWFKNSHYLKIRDRASYAFALVSAAVAVEIKNGVITDSRIALGGVATMPWRALEAETELRGKPYTENVGRQVAEAAFREARGEKYNAFKIDLGKQMLVRALNEVVAQHGGGKA